MACSKLGAVWLPLFSGFGADAVAKRLEDAQAKVLITADGFPRRGKVVPMKETADEAVASARSVRHVVVDRIGRRDTPWDLERDLRWDDLLAAHADRFETARLDPEHPLFIAYTSGTTGRPKGAVHVHGGFLVKIAEEVAYQTDVQPGDLLFWFADLGWIMGPWEIVGAALGATVFLFDGAPNHPGPDRLWSMVERHAITHLGVSPTRTRVDPLGRRARALARPPPLRILASTGEPWNPDPYRWFFEEVGKAEPADHQPVRRHRGRRLLPLAPSDQPARAVHAARPGARDGRRGVPSRRDRGRTRGGRRARLPQAVAEHDARAPRRSGAIPGRVLAPPGVWCHGDWASVDGQGSWFLHGRSDDTMNIAGKRLGPAEVESILMMDPAVTESAVVGVPDEVKGEAIWCFVVARDDRSASGRGALGPGGRASRQGVQAGAGRRGPGTAPNAVREDPPAGDPRDGRRVGSG